jgi:hypothetical protein
MTTQLDDELVLPHFEDRLWVELARLHSDLDERAAGITDGGRRGGSADLPGGHRRGPNRRRLLTAMVAAVAAGVAVGGAALLAGGDDGPSTSIAPPAQPAPSTATTVPAQRGEDGAPDAWTSSEPPTGIPPTSSTTVEHPRTRSDAVVFVEQRNAGGHVDHRWVDEATGRNRDLQLDAAGSPVLDSGWLDVEETPAGLSFRIRAVDYCFAEYLETDWTPPARPNNGTPDWHEDVRGAVDGGVLIPDGTEVVDGRELLRYRAPSYEGVTWADPNTYAPVKVHNYVGSDAEYTQTYQYLPRTQENLALLEPVVPPGFTRVDQLRGDRESLDAGCW